MHESEEAILATNQVEEIGAISTPDKPKAYAWRGLAWSLIQNEVTPLFARNFDLDADVNSRTITIIDIGSSVPALPQRIEEEWRKYCLEKVKVDIRAVSTDALNPEQHPEFSLFKTLNRETKTNLEHVFQRRNSISRQLLSGIYQDTLFEPPILQEENRIEQLTTHIFKKMKDSKRVYGKVMELPEQVGRGQWETITWQDREETFESEIEKVFPDKEQKDQFLQEVANYLAKKALPFLKYVKTQSIDLDSFEEIMRNAHIPQDGYEQTIFWYRTTQRGEKHRQDNAFTIQYANDYTEGQQFSI